MISTEKEGAQNFGQSCRWLLVVFGEGLSCWASGRPDIQKPISILSYFKSFYIFFVFLAFNFYFLETCFVVNLWFFNGDIEVTIHESRGISCVCFPVDFIKLIRLANTVCFSKEKMLKFQSNFFQSREGSPKRKERLDRNHIIVDGKMA